jgi:hypothetical protein
MSRVHSITLPLQMFVVVHHTDDRHDLEITAVEIYADAEATQPVADGLSIDDLPRSTQETIYAAVSATVDKRRREHGLRRLLTDVRLLREELRP